MTLQDALDAAEIWKAGYKPKDDEEIEPQMTNGSSATSRGRSAPQRQQHPRRPKTEEEIVAQNNAALGWLGAKLGTVQGMDNFMRN